MAIAIQCACGAPGCAITSLVFRVTVWQIPYGDFRLMGGPGGAYIGIDHAGDYTLAPIDDWLAAWDSLYVYFTASRSSNSDQLDNFHTEFKIVANMACSNGSAEARNKDTDVNECILFDEYRAMGSLGGGVITGFILHTRPLDDCQGFTVQGGNFQPPLKDVQIVDVASNANFCLCATGGTAPYQFLVSDGYPPGGVTFNPATGCFQGAPDGSYAGSDTMTISANDSARPPSVATVVCRYIRCAPILPEYKSNIFY